MFLKLSDDESGFTMVEVLVAIIILAIAIIPMVGMFDAGLKASVVGSNYDKARMLANQKLETVRALPYYNSDAAVNSAVEKYTPGTPVTGTSGTFTYTVTTTYWRELNGTVQADASDNTVVKPLMKIVVTVRWGATNSYTTTGFTSL